MNAISKVVEFLNGITTVFYNLYLETRGWIYPFSLVAGFFYTLSSMSNSIAWQFYYFSQWVDNVTDKVAGILSYENIASHFRTFLDAAGTALEWTRNAFENIKGDIGAWWSGKVVIVQAWIDEAKRIALSQIDAVRITLSQLNVAWDSFKGKIPPINEVLLWFRTWRDKVIATTITWGALTGRQIEELTNTAFKLREGYWEGWQDMRDQVVEFFADPGKWFFDRIEGWLERFW